MHQKCGTLPSDPARLADMCVRVCACVFKRSRKMMLNGICVSSSKQESDAQWHLRVPWLAFRA